MDWILTSVVQLFRDAAERMGARVEDAEQELVGDRLNAEVWSDLHPDVTAERPRRDLPESVIASRLDGTPVLFGMLVESADQADFRDAFRRYRNQATIARSWLGADAQELQLFLIGPPGVASDSQWQDTARRIEADDRICRKLVWLPPSEPTIEDAVMFLGRTFLAAPWRRSRMPAAMRLDQMSDIPLPPDWITLLEDEALSVDGLVAKLVEVTQ